MQYHRPADNEEGRSNGTLGRQPLDRYMPMYQNVPTNLSGAGDSRDASGLHQLSHGHAMTDPATYTGPVHGYQFPQNAIGIQYAAVSSVSAGAPAPSLGGLQSQAHQQQQLHQTQAHAQSSISGLAYMSAGQQQQHPQQQQQQQRLKVEDALSYLDQVKLQFSNQPQVYNDFLDIMKEFKTQTVDTPGVIDRVSNLFKGHPDLIIGFNTFLPPGYKLGLYEDTISLQQPPNAPSMIMAGPDGLAVTVAMGSNLQAISQAATYSGISGQLIALPGSQNGSMVHDYLQPQLVMDPTNQQTILALAAVNSSQQLAYGGMGSEVGGQPVEFNHAIAYVNKIKQRFQAQPDIYKNFLEILHKYQNDQKLQLEGANGSSYLPNETDVYERVAMLFKGHDDLLREFGQFLPDANGSTYLEQANMMNVEAALGGVHNDHSSTLRKPNAAGHRGTPMKRGGGGHGPKATVGSAGSAVQPQAKKSKTNSIKDASIAEASKYGTYAEYEYFDKIRKALKAQHVYDNFLKHISSFNKDEISGRKLIELVQPYLGKHSELYKWFKDFVGIDNKGIDSAAAARGTSAKEKEQISADAAMEIDFSSCKQDGVSYRVLPKSYLQPVCSGRDELCKQVLNDYWVSFPSWLEESTFGSSKKSQFEEHIYRCEDERYELDNVIETNLSTLRILEEQLKKIQRMSSDDVAKCRLDDALGGSSEILQQKAIQRIYGDKAADIIEGLKRNPPVAIPIVIRRLKAKDEEWRNAQKNFNKVWRETTDKYYLKSLDHQGVNFKQNDMKQIRAKALINEIEAIFQERQQQPGGSKSTDSFFGQPHMTFLYADRSILEDATNLLIHHMRKQSNIQSQERKRIKVILGQILPDMFHMPAIEIADDEEDESDEGDEEMEEDKDSNAKEEKKENEKKTERKTMSRDKKSSSLVNGTATNATLLTSTRTISNSTNDIDYGGEQYRLFFGNNSWYLFFYLHHILCKRLSLVRKLASQMFEEDLKCRKERKESTAIAMRLKAQNSMDLEDYYTYFLEMLKNVLDGSMEVYSFEESLRDMFGIHAYVTFTMDKITQNLVRQLQNIVMDETCIGVTELFTEERKRGGAGGSICTLSQFLNSEIAYQRKATDLLSDENCFKIVVYKKEIKVTVELLAVEENRLVDARETERWTQYIDRYVTEDEINSELKEYLCKRPVFLLRNKVQWRKGNKKGQEHVRAKEKSPQAQSGGGGAKEAQEQEERKMEISDKPDCEFRLGSYKMVYMINSETYLYKQMALKRARESHKKVSLSRHRKLGAYLRKWSASHVTGEQEKACVGWLGGNGSADSTKSTTAAPRTVLVLKNEPNFEPYHPYRTWSVEPYE